MRKVFFPFQYCILPNKAGRLIVVTLSVNGKRARFIIDTGASKSVMFANMKHDYIKGEKFFTSPLQYFGVDGQPTNCDYCYLNRVAFGKKAVVEGMYVTIIPATGINDMLVPMGIKPFVGIIGGDFLYKHKAVIDYNNKLLWFYGY